ncbi:MAG: flavodoxin family protein [Solobacterium sp.]|nr:flavodoxin family protein [Solobacterium sp.]
MSKKIVVVNAGPRKGWNTDTLLKEAIRGAETTGATVECFDLFQLEKYTGCISCFGCKKEKFKGHCVCKDGLTPVLDAIRNADALILGSPNYLGELTASFRALYERLIFQNLTYNLEKPCCNERLIPVLLIMTSNAPDTSYLDLLGHYQATLNRFVGPTEVFVSGDTLQIKDYDQTDWQWSMFNKENKKLRHETIFPKECEEVYKKGILLAENC